MIPTRTREEILAIFADLAEEDPTVLRDLLLRIARWELQPLPEQVASPWHRPSSFSWVRYNVQIGLRGQLLAQVSERVGGTWAVTVGPGPRWSHPFETPEAALEAADSWCREQGWTLPEDPR